MRKPKTDDAPMDIAEEELAKIAAGGATHEVEEVAFTFQKIQHSTSTDAGLRAGQRAGIRVPGVRVPGIRATKS